jgi:hypothetical protein
MPSTLDTIELKQRPWDRIRRSVRLRPPRLLALPLAAVAAGGVVMTTWQEVTQEHYRFAGTSRVEDLTTRCAGKS